MWRTSVLLCVTAAVLAKTKVPRVLMNDGHGIPAIAFGTWLRHTTKDSIKKSGTAIESSVTWALDAGYQHIDTAAAFTVEHQVGRAINRKIAAGSLEREDLFVTTKLWKTAHARNAVVPSLRKSLSRLNLSYVDLFLIHWPVEQFDSGIYDFTDYLATWRGMMHAKQLGLARSIGLANFNQPMMERIQQHGLERPAVLQVEVNLNLQQPELLSYCRRQNITVLGSAPFGSLFPKTARADAPPPRVDDPQLLVVADKYRKTVPQIALRYLVELGVVPVPKAISRLRIEQNIQVFDFSLSRDERVLLRGYEQGYRTVPQRKFAHQPYYPLAGAERRRWT